MVAVALTHFTRQVHNRQVGHLNFDNAIALTSFAPPTLHIEREATGWVPAHTGLRYLREELSYTREGIGIGRRIRARGSSEGRLIDSNHGIQVLQTFNRVMYTWLLMSTGEALG